jgi:hypothetical protein
MGRGILGNPQLQPKREWGERWPWVYTCGIELWVPLVKYRIHTADVAPSRAMGTIQAGGELSNAEYEAILDALRRRPEIVHR